MNNFPVSRGVIEVVAWALLAPALFLLLWSWNMFLPLAAVELRLLADNFVAFMNGPMKRSVEENLMLFVLLYLSIALFAFPKLRARVLTWSKQNKGKISLLLIAAFLFYAANVQEDSMEMSGGDYSFGKWLLRFLAGGLSAFLLIKALPTSWKYRMKNAFKGRIPPPPAPPHPRNHY